MGSRGEGLAEKEGDRGLWLLSLEKLVSLRVSFVSKTKPGLLDGSIPVLLSHAPLIFWLLT